VTVFREASDRRSQGAARSDNCRTIDTLALLTLLNNTVRRSTSEKTKWEAYYAHSSAPAETNVALRLPPSLKQATTVASAWVILGRAEVVRVAGGGCQNGAASSASDASSPTRTALVHLLARVRRSRAPKSALAACIIKRCGTPHNAASAACSASTGPLSAMRTPGPRHAKVAETIDPLGSGAPARHSDRLPLSSFRAAGDDGCRRGRLLQSDVVNTCSRAAARRADRTSRRRPWSRAELVNGSLSLSGSSPERQRVRDVIIRPPPSAPRTVYLIGEQPVVTPCSFQNTRRRNDSRLLSDSSSRTGRPARPAIALGGPGTLMTGRSCPSCWVPRMVENVEIGDRFTEPVVRSER